MHRFITIVVYGCILVAAILIYIIYRDQWQKKLFFGKNKILAWVFITILFAGVILAVRASFVEPYYLTINRQQITIDELKQPITIALITDMQIGKHKKTSWIKKIIKRIETINPDLIIFGGDLIDNDGASANESQYLEPLKKLAGKYQMYYILGNHEHGIGSSVRTDSSYWTGDRSPELIARMKNIGIPLLRGELACPIVKQQKICLYGIDDIWYEQPRFDELDSAKEKNVPLIFLTHNPDGILYWPKDKQKPDLALAGHSHGGQILLPFWGPLGNPGITLGAKYFQGLNYYNNIPIFTSVGAGESGGSVRLFVLPEIAAIELRP